MKFASVAVFVKVKAISRASVVAIVLPPTYAVCNVDAEAGQFTTLFVPDSKHNVVAVPVAFCRPFNTKVESASRLKVISEVLAGLNVTPLLNVEVPLIITVSAAASPKVTFPLAESAPVSVVVPVTAKLLFTVVVPVLAPKEIVVAAPPIFKVVALLLNTVAVPVDVVVMSAPLTAKSPVNVVSPVTPSVPPTVVFPVKVEVPSTVKLPFA